MRRLLIFLVTATLAAAGLGVAAPTGKPPTAIPRGVSIGGVKVGGLTAEPARARVLARFERPLVFQHRRERWTLDPGSIGMRLWLRPAITRAT